MKKIYQEYADLKAQEKEIKSKIAKINPLIVADMHDKSVADVATDAGKFIVKAYATWAYTDAVDNQKAKLAKLQEKEQVTGVAKVTYKPSLTFKASKHE